MSSLGTGLLLVASTGSEYARTTAAPHVASSRGNAVAAEVEDFIMACMNVRPAR